MYQLRAMMVPKQPISFPPDPLSKGLSNDIYFVLEGTRIVERSKFSRGSAQGVWGHCSAPEGSRKPTPSMDVSRQRTGKDASLKNLLQCSRYPNLCTFAGTQDGSEECWYFPKISLTGHKSPVRFERRIIADIV